MSEKNTAPKMPKMDVPKNADSADKTEKPGLENEGEGNKTAARNYDAGVEKFVRAGKVDEAAEKAKRAVDGDEGEDLRRAEEIGKKRAANG